MDQDTTSSSAAPISEKVAHVMAQGQTRDHHCHWTGCERQVPPARWGCGYHWKLLPKDLRDRIWAAYRPGQEGDAKPSGRYLEAARDVQRWIAANHPPAAKALPAPPDQSGLFD
jgi:hypothetical protein